MGIQLSLLNHACIKLEIEDVSFLFDPWLIGTCFKNGWGLRYKNDNAVNEAVNATHMWISANPRMGCRVVCVFLP